MLFGDDEMAKCILASDRPKDQKRFGRKVCNFDAKTWDEKCQDVVADGNYLKVRKLCRVDSNSKKALENINQIKQF